MIYGRAIGYPVSAVLSVPYEGLFALACNSINSTLEIFTVSLLIILMVSLLLRKSRTFDGALLFGLLVIHALNTSGDLISWRLAGEPGEVALFFTTLGNFSTYFFGALTYSCFALFVYHTITHRTMPQRISGKILAGSIIAIGLVNLGLLISNALGSGLLYTLDATNEFTWGPLRSVPDNLVLLQLVLLLPLVLVEHDTSLKETFLSFMLFAGLPIVVVVVENFFPTLMLLYPSVAISLLLIYISMQPEQERALLQKELELSQNRVKLLMGQIEPHFIFNSLLSIQELSKDAPPPGTNRP